MDGGIAAARENSGAIGEAHGAYGHTDPAELAWAQNLSMPTKKSVHALAPQWTNDTLTGLRRSFSFSTGRFYVTSRHLSTFHAAAVTRCSPR